MYKLIIPYQFDSPRVEIHTFNTARAANETQQLLKTWNFKSTIIDDSEAPNPANNKTVQP